jgi:hypothetical protein
MILTFLGRSVLSQLLAGTTPIRRVYVNVSKIHLYGAHRYYYESALLHIP